MTLFSRPEADRRQQRLLGGLVASLGVASLLVPLWPELAPEGRVGGLLVGTALAELFHGFRRSDAKGRRAAWVGGGITLGLGFLLMLAPMLAGRAILVLVAGWFAVDGIRHAVAVWRGGPAGESRRWLLLAALGNFAVIGLMAFLGQWGVSLTVAIVGALRMFGTAAAIWRAPVDTAGDAGDSVVRSLGLSEQPELVELGNRLEEEEGDRLAIDRYWIWTFILTLFAIHLGRMGLDRTTLGIVSPGFAVVGDLVVALIVGWGIVVPVQLVFRRLTRPVERQAWRWCLATGGVAGGGAWQRRMVRMWLHRRLRSAIRLRQASYSLRRALGRGLMVGLPASAILAATTPVWGVSWYFDTENYAAGIWNAWAEARTDRWREAMIQSVSKRETAAGRPAPSFAVDPPGVTAGGDFGFLIIGDTGEGDASQHVLRDQLILAAAQPEVQFVVVSSDVVYPEGEMKHYESRFWLPFKGVSKPVYAIPGNHDWYDALEGFAATFLEAGAARTVMRARVEVDLKLTGTTDARIEELLGEAARLRKEYGVPTGFQQGPFFQLQTDRFALFAIDTGVRKRVDGAQVAWFRGALEGARGKFKMAILGHPFYACGEYRAGENAEFRALHRLLREYGVRVVMAGDTHDFEYYLEGADEAGAVPAMHHFVNGGGGAFLTMGVQLADHAAMPVSRWAFHPATEPLVAKVELNNPFWKRPLWWWTKKWRAWPSAPEWLSAAFDYNVAPFFQSFVEMRVEPSAGRVRLLPWGVHGRLRWSDMATSPGLRPAGVAPDALVEWTFPLTVPGP